MRASLSLLLFFFALWAPFAVRAQETQRPIFAGDVNTPPSENSYAGGDLYSTTPRYPGVGTYKKPATQPVYTSTAAPTEVAPTASTETAPTEAASTAPSEYVTTPTAAPVPDAAQTPAAPATYDPAVGMFPPQNGKEEAERVDNFGGRASSPWGVGHMLITRTGFDLGLQFSNYHYQEPSLAMKNDGLKYGAAARGTLVLGWGFFLQADGRFAYGPVDYEGSGTAKDKDDYFWDGRVMGGKDFILDRSVSVTPFGGIGYRFLFDDLRGTTSTGRVGYRRESQYLYAPMGLNPRLRLDSESRLSLSAEYDYLIAGTQTSYLTDVNAGYGDIVNQQNGGYGARGSLMYETSSWGLGPFFNYWNINQSTTNCGITRCGFEPHNQTMEYGLQLRYRLF